MASIVKVAPAALVQVHTKSDPQIWPVIGKAWINGESKGRQMISLVLGNQSQPFEAITLQSNDRLVLRQNMNQREGKKDADFDLCLPS